MLLPVQDIFTPGLSAVHAPLHDTSSLPPSHFGGFALKSHFALPEHFAVQSAFALIDAEHFGSVNVTFSVAEPLIVPIAFTAASHQRFIRFVASDSASAASWVAFGASRS